MKTFLAIVKMSRPINCLITFTAILAACIICGVIGDNIWRALIGGVIGVLVAASGNIINDYCDFDSDKINHPHRVLPTGILDPRTALYAYYILTVLSVSFAVILGFGPLLIVITTIILLYLYSKKLKGIPLVGNLVVAALTGLAFMFGSMIVENPLCGIFPALFAFIINLSRELIKDIEDVKGDQIAGQYTFPGKYGAFKAVNIITVIVLFLILLTSIPFILSIYNVIYFVLVIMIVNGILVYIIITLRRSISAYNLVLASRLLKLSMIIGILAIILGSNV